MWHRKLVCVLKQVKMIDNSKGTILLHRRINYGRKEFKDTGPWIVSTKIEYFFFCK
jgi:hypothetical protein